MNSKSTASVALIAALLIGAMAHQVIDQEAALLGLSILEVTLLGLAAGALVRRTLPT